MKKTVEKSKPHRPLLSCPASGKSIFSAFHFFLLSTAVLLSACSSPSDPNVYAAFAPASPVYARLDIQINRSGSAGNTGTGDISLTFTANDGGIFSFTLTADDGQLYHAQDLPAMGAAAGDLLGPDDLRRILVDSGTVSAGQFKVNDAERTIAVVLQLTDPSLTAAVHPEAFRLLETNLNVLE